MSVKKIITWQETWHFFKQIFTEAVEENLKSIC